MASAKYFRTLGERASEDVFAWAAFVAQTEFLWKDPASVQDAVAWQRIWFELEILNGLALAHWEDDGKPFNWSCRWNTDYRQEASALANDLLELLCNAESSGG